MTKSYFFSLVTISCLMLLFLGVRYGFLSLIPNLFPIVFSLGLMGWLNLSMNFSTMMMACIALGLVVDDTIHFIHTFKKYFEINGDAAEAIRMTFQTTGRALLMTSIVLTFAFLVFMMATLSNFFDFGLLTAIAIFMALLSDFFITPSILILIKK
jgi:predicted RND superfamily exporter protein